MFETLGSCSWQTVYMSTQNGSHLEIRWSRILIHTLELVTVLSSCIGKPCICNIFHPRATCGTGLRAHINVTTLTIFSQNWNRLPACIVWLYYASSIMWWFPDNFFSCLVCLLLEKKYVFKNWKKIRALGSISGHNFDAEWIETRSIIFLDFWFTPLN